MNTSPVVGTVLRYLAGSAGFIAVLGLCAVLGGAVSEDPDGMAVGWGFVAVGAALLVAAIIGLVGLRGKVRP